ncbi:hypothetical protein B296_00039976, partial [Ensete ventricosum]
DYRSNRTALFDGIEEGGLRASAYSSHEIDEHDNDLAVEGLQDRVNILKRVSVNDSKPPWGFGLRSSLHVSFKFTESLSLDACTKYTTTCNINRSLLQLTGDIHEEVENHNRMLDHMGNDMDSSRGILTGTMDRFKTVNGLKLIVTVFEMKSSRRMVTLVASFVALFLLVYFLTK